jgi:hypothetical protein
MANGKWGDLAALRELAASRGCRCPCNPLTNCKEHIATAKIGDLATVHPLFNRIIPLLRFGTKYRPGMGSSEASLADINYVRAEVEALMGWWEEFLVRKLSRENFLAFFDARPPAQAVADYMTVLRDRVRLSLEALHVGFPLHHHQTEILDDAALRAIRLLQNHFVFTQVDKAASSFAVICKIKVAQDMITDLEHSSTYTFVPQSLDQTSITLEHALVHHFAIRPSYGARAPVIPPYFPIWKAHSDKFRFIVGANKSPLKSLYPQLNSIFKALLPPIRRMWKDSFKDIKATHPVPGFPVLENAHAYVRTLSVFNRIPQDETLQELRHFFRETPAPEMHSFDFDRLYTGIPLDDLFRRICDLLNDLWTYQRGTKNIPDNDSLILQLSFDTATWEHIKVGMHMATPPGGEGLFGKLLGTGATKLLFNLQALKALFKFSIDNTFLVFGGAVFRQTIGIPMGANHCVYVANLYLLQYERVFFTSLVSAIRDDNPQTSLLASHLLYTYRFLGRFIDDEACLTHNPSLFLRFLTQSHEENGISGIYPPHLGFKVTSSASKETCNFLNLHICIVPHALGHRVITGIYRKDADFFQGKVHLIKMPLFHSNIPDRYKFNVLHSQVMEYTRLCNTHETAAKAIAELMQFFTNHAYPMRPMWRRLYRSLQKVPTLYGNSARALFTLTCRHYTPPGVRR